MFEWVKFLLIMIMFLLARFTQIYTRHIYHGRISLSFTHFNGFITFTKYKTFSSLLSREWIIEKYALYLYGFIFHSWSYYRVKRQFWLYTFSWKETKCAHIEYLFTFLIQIYISWFFGMFPFHFTHLIFLMANSSSRGLMYSIYQPHGLQTMCTMFLCIVLNLSIYFEWFFIRRDMTTPSLTRHLIRTKILSRWSIHTSSHQKL